jgi:hypothetical protein
MLPRGYYRLELEQTRETLKKYRARRNLLTAAKLALFAGIPLSLYFFARREDAWGAWGALFFLLAFIACNVVESRLLVKIAFNRRREGIVETELVYLEGDVSRLDRGDEFRDPRHPYSRDLDIFGEASIFQSLNRAVTPAGRERLAGWLATPSLSIDEIRDRQEAARELQEEPDWCLDFRATGSGRAPDARAVEHARRWQGEATRWRPVWRPVLHLLPAFVLAGWALWIAGLAPWIIPLGGSLLQLCLVALNFRAVNREHARLDLFVRSLGSSRELVELVARLSPRSRGLRALRERLTGRGHDAHAAFASLRRVLGQFDRRGNWLATVVLNGLYMSDLHLVRRLDAWREAHAGHLPGWIEAVGEVDALVSLANHAFNHPAHVRPLAREGALLEGVAIGHPLIPAERRVTNDFRVDRLHEFYIITGANMAGKSTFLRAVGVNLVLAGAGSVVCASSFAFRPAPLFSSMRTVDNLAGGTSYFLAELTRLKELVETAGREERLFIILDEILKGTNSVDKLDGSRRFLRKLLELPVSGIVATHDLELGELARLYPGHYVNRCFEITHEDDDIVYDYKLKPGVSQNMNASILLEKMNLC